MNNTGEGSTERQRYLSSASQTSYLERVKELARVRDTDPTRYPSALAQVKVRLAGVILKFMLRLHVQDCHKRGSGYRVRLITPQRLLITRS